MSVFLRAIDVINERGWGIGMYENPVNGKVCLVGACAIAAGKPMSESSWFEAESPCMDILRHICIPSSPTWYSDVKATTKEDIINILQKAYEYECELAKPTEHLSVLPV